MDHRLATMIMKTFFYNYKKYIVLAGVIALIAGFAAFIFWQTNFQTETVKADYCVIDGNGCQVCYNEACEGCGAGGCCDNCVTSVNCPPSPPAASPESCNECGSCGDSRYRWCEGGQYGAGNCVDFICDCRPDLCGPPAPSVDLSGQSIIEVPSPFELSWSSFNADSCAAISDPVGFWKGNKSLSGSETLNLPRGVYNFTLSCSGPGGTAVDTMTVRVIQVPNCVFWADPASIIIPQKSSLKWTCQYADSCSIDQGVGSVCSTEAECSSDFTNVRPKQTTTYALTCSGLDGSRFYNAVVNVGFFAKLREICPTCSW